MRILWLKKALACGVLWGLGFLDVWALGFWFLGIHKALGFVDATALGFWNTVLGFGESEFSG